MSRKDEEASATWLLKDELIRRGNVYYAKLARGKTMFIAPRMIPYFNAIWGMRRSEEKSRLSRDAQKILKVLRKEYGTPFAWTSGVLILLVWEHYGAAGAPPLGRGEFAVIIAIWIVLAVAYLIVRTLKLSGRLGTT